MKMTMSLALLVVLSMATTYGAFGQVGGFQGSGAYKIRGPGGYLNTKTDGSLFMDSNGSVLWFVGKQEDGSYWMKARFVGDLNEIAPLEPIFRGNGPESLTGRVRVNESSSATWNITPDLSQRFVHITAANIPPSVTFPSSGKVYLVSRLASVFWKWDGGFLPFGPAGASWTFEENFGV